MLRIQLLSICVAAALLQAQDHVPLNRVDLLEAVQNDLAGALARGTFSYGNRVEMNRIVGVLGRSIGSERGSHTVDEKELKSTLKDIQRVSKESGLASQDRLTLERDCEALKYNLEHGPPMYRGYKQPMRY